MVDVCNFIVVSTQDVKFQGIKLFSQFQSLHWARLVKNLTFDVESPFVRKRVRLLKTKERRKESMKGMEFLIDLQPILAYNVRLDIVFLRLLAFHECSSSLPSLSARWQDPSLFLFITKYGPSHLDWSLPTFLAFGFLFRTQSPTEMSFLTTFLSLHFLVCCWYLLWLSYACSISSSKRIASSEGCASFFLFSDMRLRCLSS